MSTIAINPIHRAVRFYEAPIGKKAIMAITGLVLFGYVVAHLLGNLQIYSANPEQINHYAAFLHNPANAAALWIARLVLLLCVILHITAATDTVVTITDLRLLGQTARLRRYVERELFAAPRR